MKAKILIYGIGSLGEKLYKYNLRDQIFEIVGFVDDKINLHKSYLGLPVYNYDQCLSLFPSLAYKIFIAIGYVRCNKLRELVSNRVKSDGYSLVNYVSPNSICWDGTLIGDNIFVADNVFVGHGCKIHNGVIIYEGCTLSHDTELMDNCFISLRVAFGGFSKVNKNSFIGLNSTIKDNITIAAYNIVGGGTNVIKSTEEYSLTVGNPGVSRKGDTTNMSI